MDPAVLRDDMVDSLEHEAKACVRSERVSVAMRAVPRHDFVDDERGAYADRAFERHGTRVLSPSTVARLLEALDLRADHSVLVVGAGVGYTTALCAEIASPEHVHSIDIARKLVWEARGNLDSAGYSKALVDCRDGANGLPEYAPYDRILVEAAAIEPPQSLVDQLAPDGRMILPVGASPQTLVAVDSAGEIAERFGTVAFSPMLVDGEQAGGIERNRTQREDREHAQRARERRHGWEQEWIDWDSKL